MPHGTGRVNCFRWGWGWGFNDKGGFWARNVVDELVPSEGAWGVFIIGPAPAAEKNSVRTSILLLFIITPIHTRKRRIVFGTGHCCVLRPHRSIVRSTDRSSTTLFQLRRQRPGTASDRAAAPWESEVEGVPTMTAAAATKNGVTPAEASKGSSTTTTTSTGTSFLVTPVAILLGGLYNLQGYHHHL